MPQRAGTCCSAAEDAHIQRRQTPRKLHVALNATACRLLLQILLCHPCNTRSAPYVSDFKTVDLLGLLRRFSLGLRPRCHRKDQALQSEHLSPVLILTFSMNIWTKDKAETSGRRFPNWQDRCVMYNVCVSFAFSSRFAVCGGGGGTGSGGIGGSGCGCGGGSNGVAAWRQLQTARRRRRWWRRRRRSEAAAAATAAAAAVIAERHVHRR
ncbi:unnamed protein product [Phaeothamnion confervicola]